MESIQQRIRNKIGVLKRKVIEVNEWGGEPVEIMELDATLLEDWETSFSEYFDQGKNPQAVRNRKFSIRAQLIGMSIVNEDGTRPFNSVDGFKELSKLQGRAIDQLYDEIMKFNKLGRYLEEEAKNLDDGQSNDSSESLLEAVRSIPIP